MEETLNKFLKIILKYSAHRWVYTLVGGYFFVSLILFTWFDLDIGIPCLIKLSTGYSCPGCGLTHAFSHLLQFEFVEAWHHNKLFILVVPFGLYYVLKDFRQFYLKNTNPSNFI